MKKIFKVAAVVVFVCAQFANAAQFVMQLVTISGTVYDDPYPANRVSFPIKDAKVYLSGAIEIISASTVQPSIILDSTTTDQSGNFSFRPVLAGTLRISVLHANYAGRAIAVTTETDTSFRITLVSNSARASFRGSVMVVACPGIVECIGMWNPGCTVSVHKIGVIPLFSPQSKSGDPIASVPVVSILVGQAITNDSGHYSIDSVPIAVNGERVTVTVSKTGYTAKSVDTTIWNLQTIPLDFSLAAALPQRDTVLVTPEKPSTQDSVTFRLFSTAHCCCAIYRDTRATVSDTAIYLNYYVNDSLCQFCRCAGGGSWATFKTGTIEPGAYGIYKIEMPNCPAGEKCPMFVAPVRVGTMTIKRSASARFPHGSSASAAVTARFLVQGNALRADLPQSGIVCIRVFSLRGELLAQPYERHLTQGSHQIALSSLMDRAGFHETVIVDILMNGAAADHLKAVSMHGKTVR